MYGDGENDHLHSQHNRFCLISNLLMQVDQSVHKKHFESPSLKLHITSGGKGI